MTYCCVSDYVAWCVQDCAVRGLLQYIVLFSWFCVSGMSLRLPWCIASVVGVIARHNQVGFRCVNSTCFLQWGYRCPMSSSLRPVAENFKRYYSTVFKINLSDNRLALWFMTWRSRLICKPTCWVGVICGLFMAAASKNLPNQRRKELLPQEAWGRCLSGQRQRPPSACLPIQLLSHLTSQQGSSASNLIGEY